ncbi:MAG: sulfur oxidation c-type cytochrome SoxX [Rhodobacteraceae bacterium]|nr:sulfur oxidation c-type cytochrome SoxX [Paracoccaceae bacterium]
MKQTVLGLVISAVIAGTAIAGPVSPQSVVYADGAVAASLSGATGDPSSGREIIITKGQGNCIACHASEALADAAWHGEVGPVLDGVGDRWSEAELRGIIANAKMMFEGTVMPSFYKTDGFIRPGDGYTGEPATQIDPILSAQQIEDVVAYLMTLKE